ncbi:putative ariadne-1 protein [Obelidium mucronatum]|nr:putative ariadne-1 protein [Obelidium mucronatum]
MLAGDFSDEDDASDFYDSDCDMDDADSDAGFASSGASSCDDAGDPAQPAHGLAPASVLTKPQVAGLRAALVARVAATAACDAPRAAALLVAAQWNIERAVDAALGGASDWSAAEAPAAAWDECPVCFDTDASPLALACQHRFCKNCYKEYLTTKIVDQGESAHIQCLDASCSLVVDQATVESIVDPAVHSKYLSLLLDHFVQCSKSLAWCPAPNCQMAIECLGASSKSRNRGDAYKLDPVVSCSCGNVFCFGCSLQNHLPTPCSVVKMWLKKCVDDSETANWINANTKDCPKCDAPIEKNGGCNHLHCRKCNHHFCWVCMGEFPLNYKHSCALWEKDMKEEDKVQADSTKTIARKSLERYLHYFTRYYNHDQSAKLDQNLSEKLETIIMELQENAHLSWIDSQFMKESKEILISSRHTLKWTYCFAFYLVRDVNATIIFEQNQQDLESAVEELSGLLESEFTPESVEGPEGLRIKIIDKMGYVKKRREVLLESAMRDIDEEKLSWDMKK